jgi:hypothetical protein
MYVELSGVYEKNIPLNYADKEMLEITTTPW